MLCKGQKSEKENSKWTTTRVSLDIANEYILSGCSSKIVSALYPNRKWLLRNCTILASGNN